jgi:hypothetical protein
MQKDENHFALKGLLSFPLSGYQISGLLVYNLDLPVEIWPMKSSGCVSSESCNVSVANRDRERRADYLDMVAKEPAVADPVEVVPCGRALKGRVRDSAAERIGICSVSIRLAVACQIPMTAERIVECDGVPEVLHWMTIAGSD